MTHPLPVTACNLDMENLISDPNRSIATLAITTLLKVYGLVASSMFVRRIPDALPITDWQRDQRRQIDEADIQLHE